ncbi:hypothetical protein C8P68_103219 [Mucilaginibacter yixingensis]|uniref:Uncharacterized protein n=1 Tax=Mucilaginibacter yixingensis TaxID=1295612 RepID=A0A2T5JB96_9SPHI|nr:DUF6263 family protein [Mucilaginibacter yixingensis]PTQ98059.1 hypothetical protein C8P68_103219 [Mucilaginibacter yixingensis]
MKKLIALSLLFAALNSYAQKVNLALNLKRDSVYNLTIDAKVSTQQVIQGKPTIVNIAISGTTAHKVIGVKDSVYDLETSYKSLAMNMDMAGQQMTMNSADTTTILGKIMHLVMGKPFHIWMSKSGLIISVKGFDDIFTNAANSVTALNEQQRNLIVSQLKQSFGEGSLKSSLQQSFIIYPKQALASKGTWKNAINREQSGMAASYNTTYTLVDIGDDAYEIEGKTLIAPQPSVGFKQAGGFLIHMANVKGDGVTKLRVDRNTGWVLASVVEQHVSATVEMKKTTTGPVEMSLPMTIAVNYTATDK